MSGIGAKRNGKRAEFAPTRENSRVAGLTMNDYINNGGLPTGAGFYLLSSDNAGVIKLGMSKGTGGRGVSARVDIAFKYWGGDMRIHELREFEYNDPERQAGKWKGPKRPAGFARDFESEVKKATKALGWTGEFYTEPDTGRRKDMIRRVLAIIDRVHANNTDPNWRDSDYNERRKSRRLAEEAEIGREVSRGFRD